MTSQVDYSTDPALPASATLTQTDGAFVLQHSLTLTGLASAATYYFRVISMDADDNIQVAFPLPSFTVPGPTLHDTTTADSSAGTFTTTHVVQRADGEVTLEGAVGSEFNTLPAPLVWTTTQWDPGGSATVGSGALHVDGALFGTTAAYSPGHSLEFVATFESASFQAAGLGTDLIGPPWAIFSTRNQGYRGYRLRMSRSCTPR